MLIGEHIYNLDSKGRISFPPKFREELGDHFFITRGVRQCLCCYDIQTWERMAEEYERLSIKADVTRHNFFGGASEVEADGSGRIMLSPRQRQYAKLTHDVIVVGQKTHVEIWDLETYDGFLTSETEEERVGKMEELGY